MKTEPSELRIGRIILVPALITLGVTLLRLVGEINRWSQTFFNRAAGGPGAIVGIVWLVPVFGIYFALYLSRRGHGPASRARAIGCALAGVATYVALYAVVSRLPVGILGRMAGINLGAAVSAFVASRGWPQLAKTELAYGLAARVPVALVMLAAMYAQWGTHYELGPPGFPSMGTFATWLWIGLLPQMVFWIGYTVLVGTLFGSLAVAVLTLKTPRP